MRRLLVLMLVALVAGCGSPSTGAGTPPQGWPADRTFLSTAVTENGQAKQLAPGTQVSLRFRATTGITANAGCNTIDATGHLDGDQFVADQVGMTAMGCDQPRADQDTWLAGVLSARLSWQLTGDQLVVTAGATRIELVDRRVAQPDRNLVGTAWTVTGQFDRQVASSLPDGPAVITFKDGNVTASTGCATLTGPATVSGTGITVGPLTRTQPHQPCDGLTATLDSAVTTVLTGTLTATITGPNLTLSTVDGHGLTLRAG